MPYTLKEIRDAFDKFDTNPKDGKLSKEEVLAFFKKQGRDELPEGLWEKEDKNEDGVISWEEFSGPKGKTAPPLKDEV